MNDKRDSLKNKSFAFALSSIKSYKTIVDFKKEYILSKQFLKASTSIGANIREAKNAESKADFVHKLSIAQKECDESIYWLELLYLSQYLSETEYLNLLKDATEILKMIRSSIITIKTKYK